MNIKSYSIKSKKKFKICLYSNSLKKILSEEFLASLWDSHFLGHKCFKSPEKLSFGICG